MSDDERIRRIGHNEALYRQVNERIEGLNDAFSLVTSEFAVICECGDLHCMQQVRVSREVYEQTRANATRFIIVPGHEAPDVEEVVERGNEYFVVDKEPPAARRVAEETNPPTRQ